MSISMDAANALERVIDGKIAKAAPKRTAAEGVVTRVDADGTAYVRLDGSDVDTPAARTAAKVKPGQRVSGTVRDGELVIDGNYSAPATDDTTANAAIASAKKAAKSAKSAQDAADEAQKVADATNQHFWHDGNGVHVTEAEGDATTEHNILMNSLGILLRKALYNLVSITASAVAFFDGSGNTAEHITAQFGGDGTKLYADGALRHKTDVDGSHYYAGDGATKVLSVGAGKRYGRDSALLTFLGETMLNTDDAGMTIETYASGSWSNRTTIDLLAYGTNFNSAVTVDSAGRIILAVDRLSDNTGPGITIDGTGLQTDFHGRAIFGDEARFNDKVTMVSYLDFSSMPNASTSTDFFATGIQAFENGGRLRYKGLADMKSWLGITGIDSLVKVVSATSSEISISAGGNHTYAPTLTIPSGYTLVGALGAKFTANNANLSSGALYKYSDNQIAVNVVNHGSSARSVAVTTYGLCVRTAFVG